MREKPGDQYTFDVTHNTMGIKNLLENGVESDSEVAIGGRLMAIRDLGKIAFCDLHDEEGAIQLVARQQETAEYDKFTDNTIGDWIGVKGIAGTTKAGEPSLFVNDWVKLAQTELPFPDKHKGLKDPETIARQRYLDLAVNPDSTKRFKDRSRIISMVRRELEAQNFMEVETPVLQNLYGGAAARPFETHHNALDIALYMRIAPELYLKRLVVGGLTRVFEIGKVFRNEGISPKHNPEFTMMEVYAAYWDHEGQMQLTENLVANTAKELTGSTTIEYQGREVDLTPPWERKTMDELLSREIDQEVSLSTDIKELRNLCKQHDVQFEPEYGSGKLLLELYEKLVEPKLWGPTFVTEYPKEVSPLARSHRDKPGYTERFEGIVAGSELCNGFSELNDPEEQYHRFNDQETASEYDEEAMKMDHDYIRALKYGLPPTAGLGIGIDRLVMLLTNSSSIKDVVLFPTLRPDDYKTSY